MQFINPKAIAFSKTTCFVPSLPKLNAIVRKDLRPQIATNKKCKQFSLIMWVNMPNARQSYGIGFPIN